MAFWLKTLLEALFAGLQAFAEAWRKRKIDVDAGVAAQRAAQTEIDHQAAIAATFEREYTRGLSDAELAALADSWRFKPPRP